LHQESVSHCGTPEDLTKEATEIDEGLKVDPDLNAHSQLYFSLYFAMTGLHALHMNYRRRTSPISDRPGQQRKIRRELQYAVENIGLYWHFVDIVWIYLFRCCI